MTKAVKHVVFDIGNVLINYDCEVPFKRLIPDAQKRRWFLDNVCTPQWNVEQDRGRPWPEAENLLIADYPEHSEHIRAFRKYWHDMITGPLDRSVEIFNAVLQTGTDVTMLTNFASDTFAEARQRFGFLQKPRGVTVSGDAGLLKPDIEIYRLHARDFDLEPEACLFIDDSKPNVEGARKAGWQAVHFTSPSGLAEDLKHHGVL